MTSKNKLFSVANIIFSLSPESKQSLVARLSTNNHTINMIYRVLALDNGVQDTVTGQKERTKKLLEKVDLVKNFIQSNPEITQFTADSLLNAAEEWAGVEKEEIENKERNRIIQLLKNRKLITRASGRIWTIV